MGRFIIRGIVLATVVGTLLTHLSSSAQAARVHGQMFELEENQKLVAKDGTVTVSINRGGRITELGTFDNGDYDVTVPDNVRFELLFDRGGGTTNTLELRSITGRNMQIDLPVPEFKHPCSTCSTPPCGHWRRIRCR
jgi:hypothetical protein